jgi:hypothetical protein
VRALGTTRIDWPTVRALQGSMSNANFAAACGVSRGALKFMESQSAPLAEIVVERIAAVLGVTVERLRVVTPAPICRNGEVAGCSLGGNVEAGQERARRAKIPWEAVTSLGLGSSLADVVNHMDAALDRERTPDEERGYKLNAAHKLMEAGPLTARKRA